MPSRAALRVFRVVICSRVSWNPFSARPKKTLSSLLKTKKAAGLDHIRNEMLKSGINHLISSLVKLFNFIIRKGSFLYVWSKGLISPIFKSGSKSDPNNYRGICVTSCLGKLFSSLLNTRLSNYFHENNLLHHSQIGLLKGYRTTDHIFSLRTLIYKYVVSANKGKLFCCFVDFQKPLCGTKDYFLN